MPRARVRGPYSKKLCQEAGCRKTCPCDLQICEGRDTELGASGYSEPSPAAAARKSGVQVCWSLLSCTLYARRKNRALHFSMLSFKRTDGTRNKVSAVAVEFWDEDVTVVRFQGLACTEFWIQVIKFAALPLTDAAPFKVGKIYCSRSCDSEMRCAMTHRTDTLAALAEVSGATCQAREAFCRSRHKALRIFTSLTRSASLSCG